MHIRLVLLTVMLLSVLFGTACDSCRLRFLNTTIPVGVVGEPYEGIADVNCEVDEFTLLSGTLPPGIQLVGQESALRISGTPMAEGDYVFMVEAVRYAEQDNFTGDVDPGSSAVVTLALSVLPAGSNSPGPQNTLDARTNGDVAGGLRDTSGSGSEPDTADESDAAPDADAGADAEADAEADE